jgi:sphingosine kinase
MQHLLRARLSTTPHQSSPNRRLDIHALLVKSKANSLRLSTMHVLVEPQHADEAGKWVETCMLAAYPGLKPCRRVLLLVNPVGGKGKAKAIARDTVLPILEAAGCLVEYKGASDSAVLMPETTHRLHAEEIARDMVLDNYEWVVLFLR